MAYEGPDMSDTAMDEKQKVKLAMNELERVTGALLKELKRRIHEVNTDETNVAYHICKLFSTNVDECHTEHLRKAITELENIQGFLNINKDQSSDRITLMRQLKCLSVFPDHTFTQLFTGIANSCDQELVKTIYLSMNEMISNLILFMESNTRPFDVWLILLRLCKIVNRQIFSHKAKAIQIVTAYLKTKHPERMPNESGNIKHFEIRKSIDDLLRTEGMFDDNLINLLTQNVIEKRVKEMLIQCREKEQLEKYLMLTHFCFKFGFDISRDQFLHDLKSFDIVLKMLENMSDTETETYEQTSQRKVFIDFIQRNEKESVKKVLQHISAISIGIDPYICKILKNDDTHVLLQTLQEMKDSDAQPTFTTAYFQQHNNQTSSFFNTSENDVNGLDVENLPNTVAVKDETDKSASRYFVCMLAQLGLQNKYPGKITLQDVLTIQDGMHDDPREIKDLPFAILRKIICADFRFRDKVLQTLDEKYQNDDYEISEMHPSDLHLCIYLCSDMHLQRVIAYKMSLCQVGLPFIHPNFSGDNNLTLSKWPLRHIVVGNTGESVLSVEMKCMSFIRIGPSGQISKSKTINELLRENEVHDTFFHRDLSMGQNKRLISNGVIEISWYVPSKEDLKQTSKEDGTSSKNFKEPLTVLNLRGDGVDHKTQLDVLSNISDVIILCVESKHILLDEKYKTAFKKIYTGKSKVLLFITCDDNKTITLSLKELSAENEINGELAVLTTFDEKKKRKRNTSDIKRCLTSEINKLLNKRKTTMSLEKAVMHTEKVLEVDEDKPECKKGRTNAEDLFSDLKDNKERCIVLPLQGEELWHRLSTIQKEMNRSGKCAQQSDYSFFENQVSEIRKQQRDAFNLKSPFIAKFVDILSSNKNDKDTIMFTLSWLTHLFDERSRHVLPDLSKRFKEAFDKYSKISNSHTVRELKLADRNLVFASFGLEHCFREIGQIYEAFFDEFYSKQNCLDNTMNVIQKFPTTVAQILLYGHPLELMDGDAGNVPINWIQSVFKAVQSSLGDLKIYTISVLGIQSSGKSTLLNSMFGLQFAVSAGRCTRGIYMQLIPVNRAMSSLQFDYALIVDTEGLHAPELFGNRLHHDNELATFVIGIADLIIINVKGETLGDLENVLQIAVHCIIRLKRANPNIKMKQFCKLVHQNVSAQDAERQLMQGHHKTMKCLDEITREVASSEQMQGIHTFNDVIKFDPLTSVVCLYDFWLGTPPMTPVNPYYCSKVIELKERIFSEAKQKCFHLSDISDYIKDLWDGILKEDFVFSFRNCIEFKAYNLLEEQYKILTWKMEKTLTDWCSSTALPTIEGCDDPNHVDELSDILSSKVDNLLSTERSTAVAELLKFIDESDLNEQLIQWKENKANGLDCFANELKHDISRRIKKCTTHCKLDIRSRTLLSSKEKELHERAKTLANKFKGKDIEQTEKDSEFDKMWSKWFNEIETEYKDSLKKWSPDVLKGNMEKCLRERFHSHKPLLTKLKEIFKEELDKDIDINQLNIKLHMKKISQKNKMKNVFGLGQDVYIHVSNAFRDIYLYISGILREDNECTSTTFSEVLNEFYGNLESNTSKKQVKVTTEIEIVTALFLLEYCCASFNTHNRNHFQRHSVKYKLGQHKEKARNLFLDILSDKSKEHIAANAVCRELKDIVFKTLLRDVPNNIKDHILNKFSHTKYSLIKDILKEFAENESQEKFDRFKGYIRSPATFSNEWLVNKINLELFGPLDGTTRSKFLEWTCTKLSIITRELVNCANEVENSGDFLSWIKGFCANKHDHVRLFESSFSHLSEHGVKDIENFCSCIMNGLREMDESLQHELVKITFDNIVWPDDPPYKSIFERLWGCKATCPWCGEPCQNATVHVASEPHRCIQHRSVGIGGVHITPSKQLAVESCNFKVQSNQSIKCGKWCGCTCDKSHSYRDYKTYIPEWDIAPSPDKKSTEYWAWFIANYSKQLADYYENKEPDIPDSWRKITKKKAVDSLSQNMSTDPVKAWVDDYNTNYIPYF